MKTPQPGILQPLSSHARYLYFSVEDPNLLTAVLARLPSVFDPTKAVVGLGQGLLKSLKGTIDGLKSFSPLTIGDTYVDRAPEGLWLWLKGEDPGTLWHESRQWMRDLSPALSVQQIWDAFVHQDGRDLTGYEDGTENPEGEAAAEAAIITRAGAMQGSSFVVVQPWLHDFEHFARMHEEAQDAVIGRRRSDNEELDEAPASAHVKRTAQEGFSPEAFVLRRSMPWVKEAEGGLMFVCFANSFDPFEVQFKRMCGEDDGVMDALFSFTHPLSGAYFWCPPLDEGRLDLSLLGLT